MIKCEVCEGNADVLSAVVLNCDGDFACSEECAKKYKEERDHFFNHVVHDDNAFADWLGVPIIDQIRDDDE